MNPEQTTVGETIAVWGLVIALVFFSNFDWSATPALWIGMFFLVLVWLNAWQQGKLQQLVGEIV